MKEKIVEVAKSFIGQKEVKGNKGFIDDDFYNKMLSVGFVQGYAWCSLFAELVYKIAYEDLPEIQKLYTKLFSASTYRTLRNFEKAGYKFSKKAEVGSLVIWRKKRKGILTNLGHAGICVEVHKNYFMCTEGNTNSIGSREGDIVATKKRGYDYEVYSGLELVGFLHAIEEVKKEVELPFKNKKEGDKFRRWFNDNYPEIAKEIDLDRKGSYNNSYIKKAYLMVHEVYEG